MLRARKYRFTLSFRVLSNQYVERKAYANVFKFNRENKRFERAKVNSRCFHWFPVAKTWRLHTKPSNFQWNLLPNNSSWEYRTSPKLWHVVYLLLFYDISISWLTILKGKRFYFSLVWLRSRGTRERILILFRRQKSRFLWIKLAAPLSFCWGFGPRFRVHWVQNEARSCFGVFRSVRPIEVFLELVFTPTAIDKKKCSPSADWTELFWPQAKKN